MFSLDASAMDISPGRSTTQVWWTPPQADWFKINSYGSILYEEMRAACGGPIRDASGSCLIAYACNIGNYSITHAELYGIGLGHKVAADVVFRKCMSHLTLEGLWFLSKRVVRAACNTPIFLFSNIGINIYINVYIFM